MMTQTTVDTLLGGRFEVEQPAQGYRIAVDTLLLASAIPAQAGQRVCELGCGVGGVMLAVATRVPDVSILGVELQSSMAALCASNIRRNAFQERLTVIEGDVAALPSELTGAFDHVMMNPPYHDHRSHSVSANVSKRLAHAESDDADLAVWIAQAAQCLKAGGMLSLIHRGDRLDDILEIARGYFVSIGVKPIVSKQNAPAKRVIVRAIKGGGGNELEGVTRDASCVGEDGAFSIQDSAFGKGCRIPDAECLPHVVSVFPPFKLYGPDGHYSQAGEAILRGCQAMSFEDVTFEE